MTTMADTQQKTVGPVKCLSDTNLLGNEVGPYLFPFVIEFALIASSILFRISDNVGKIPSKKHKVEKASSIERAFEGCHKANTGLFRGLFFTVVIVLLTALFLIIIDRFPDDDRISLIGAKIYFSCNISLNLLGIIATIPAFLKLRYLKYSKLKSSFDQNLAYIALGGYYFLIAAMLVASAADLGQMFSYLHFFSNIITFIQVTLQTIFITDALRRRSIQESQVVLKPGRSAVTFLLILNIAMWVVNTFQLKQLTGAQSMANFYGHLAWVIVIQIFLPLCIFYRFHSAVCLAEVWTTAYELEEEEEEDQEKVVTPYPWYETVFTIPNPEFKTVTSHSEPVVMNNMQRQQTADDEGNKCVRL